MSVTTLPAKPGAAQLQEVITDQVLAVQGLDPQAFTGARNPTTIWNELMAGATGVFELYFDLEEKDSAISAALETRYDAVVACDSNVKSANEEDPFAQLLAEEAAAFLDEIPAWENIQRELLDSRARGYAVAEIFWRIENARVVADKIVARPQKLFRFAPDNFGLTVQTGELHYSASGFGFEFTPAPPGRFLTMTHRPRYGDRRGQPLLRRVFWLSWFVRNVMRVWLRHLEKGDGTIAVKYQSGADDKVKDQALESAQAIANEVAVAFSNNFELQEQLLGSVRSMEPSHYQNFISDARAEITRVILGQTLTTKGNEGGTGSRSLGETHEGTKNDKKRSDALDLELVANEQLLRPWLLWNFGPRALEREFRPWWTIEKDPPKDLSTKADLWLKLQQLGVSISVNQAYEEFDVRQPTAGEAVLEASSPGFDLLNGSFPPPTEQPPPLPPEEEEVLP